MSPWLQISALVMALIIVVAGFRVRRAAFEAKAWMGVAWLVIIIVAALIFTRLGW